MQAMSAAECSHLNDIMRSIQRKFVVEALAECLGDTSVTDGLDHLVASVRANCHQKGATFSEHLVRELIIEISEKLGYEGPV
jgi:hypothetical protein